MERLKTLLRKMLLNTYVKTLLTGIAVAVGLVLGTAIFLHIQTQHGRSFPVPDLRGLQADEVAGIASQHHLRAEITDSSYIMNRAPGVVIEQNPEPGTHVKNNRRVFLAINARSPMMVHMPNVMGYTLRQAKAILEQDGLEVGTLRFKPDLGVYNVLGQELDGANVEAGQEIPKGSKITLVLGRGMYGEQTNLPQLIGLKLGDARNLIIEAALNVGKIQFDETIKDYKDSLSARVYDQYPAYSEPNDIAFGTKVNIWLTLNQSRIRSTQRDSAHIYRGETTSSGHIDEDEILD